MLMFLETFGLKWSPCEMLLIRIPKLRDIHAEKQPTSLVKTSIRLQSVQIPHDVNYISQLNSFRNMYRSIRHAVVNFMI